MMRCWRGRDPSVSRSPHTTGTGNQTVLRQNTAVLRQDTGPATADNPSHQKRSEEAKAIRDPGCEHSGRHKRCGGVNARAVIQICVPTTPARDQKPGPQRIRGKPCGRRHTAIPPAITKKVRGSKNKTAQGSMKETTRAESMCTGETVRRGFRLRRT